MYMYWLNMPPPAEFGTAVAEGDGKEVADGASAVGNMLAC